MLKEIGRMPVCAITSVDNFVDKKTAHFRSISITFRSKTEKSEKNRKKRSKPKLPILPKLPSRKI